MPRMPFANSHFAQGGASCAFCSQNSFPIHPTGLRQKRTKEELGGNRRKKEEKGGIYVYSILWFMLIMPGRLTEASHKVIVILVPIHPAFAGVEIQPGPESDQDQRQRPEHMLGVNTPPILQLCSVLTNPNGTQIRWPCLRPDVTTLPVAFCLKAGLDSPIEDFDVWGFLMGFLIFLIWVCAKS